MRSWWVVAYSLLLYGTYDLVSRQQQQERMRLEETINEMERALIEAQETNHLLQLEIASRDDPASIELALMQGLGMVPAGQRKIFFQPRAE